jgi:hypothetical protein
MYKDREKDAVAPGERTADDELVLITIVEIEMNQRPE